MHGIHVRTSTYGKDRNTRTASVTTNSGMCFPFRYSTLASYSHKHFVPSGWSRNVKVIKTCNDSTLKFSVRKEN